MHPIQTYRLAWGRLFYKYLQTQFFPSFAFCFIPQQFIVGIRYNEATLQPLIRGGLLKPFFVVAFLLFALHVLLQCSVLFKPPLQVCNFTLRRFKVFLLHCCRLYWRRFVVYCFHAVVSLFLNCTAKVVQITETCKHFGEKMSIL